MTEKEKHDVEILIKDFDVIHILILVDTRNIKLSMENWMELKNKIYEAILDLYLMKSFDNNLVSFLGNAKLDSIINKHSLVLEVVEFKIKLAKYQL